MVDEGFGLRVEGGGWRVDEKERTRCLGIPEDEEGGQRREDRDMMETSRRGSGRIEQKER